MTVKVITRFNLVDTKNANLTQIFVEDNGNTLPYPEISGWVAWWKEKEAYDLIASNSAKIKTVSPVWYMVDDSFEVAEVGTVNKLEVINQLNLQGVKVIPTLGSEIRGSSISPLFQNVEIQKAFISDLVNKLVFLRVDGLDVDLEEIRKEDKDAFTNFLQNLKIALDKDGLKLTVAVHAQTEKLLWDGVLGQDLKAIGEMVHEVRVMAYDMHTSDTGPGPVASLDWIDKIADYNLKMVPKEKLVMGIPSYGYVWQKDGTARGYQFDEFEDFIEGKGSKEKRDIKSGELHVRDDEFEGYLSDSKAMIAKMQRIREMGINKFVIWHLGGLDEQLFEEVWTSE